MCWPSSPSWPAATACGRCSPPLFPFFARKSPAWPPARRGFSHTQADGSAGQKDHRPGKPGPIQALAAAVTEGLVLPLQVPPAAGTDGEAGQPGGGTDIAHGAHPHGPAEGAGLVRLRGVHPLRHSPRPPSRARPSPAAGRQSAAARPAPARRAGPGCPAGRGAPPAVGR